MLEKPDALSRFCAGRGGSQISVRASPRAQPGSAYLIIDLLSDAFALPQLCKRGQLLLLPDELVESLLRRLLLQPPPRLLLALGDARKVVRGLFLGHLRVKTRTGRVRFELKLSRDGAAREEQWMDRVGRQSAQNDYQVDHQHTTATKGNWTTRSAAARVDESPNARISAV
mgnify:FL=1